MNEFKQKIEKEIQDKNLNAPRLRPEDIDAVIVGETYTKLPSGKVMICELTLKNGFTIRGESACVSPENFNEELGRKISRDNARNKIWELEGYLLQEREFQKKAIRKIAEKFAGANEGLKGLLQEAIRENCRFEEAGLRPAIVKIIEDAGCVTPGVVVMSGSLPGELFKTLFAPHFQKAAEKPNT